MVSFKEITDLAVLSYGMNFINDAEFLLLYNSYSSENLYLPYHLYPEFDLQKYENRPVGVNKLSLLMKIFVGAALSKV